MDQSPDFNLRWRMPDLAEAKMKVWPDKYFVIELEFEKCFSTNDRG